MFKTRVALLGLLTLLITSGIMASTASAGPGWKVNGSPLNQGQERQLKLKAGITELKGTVSLEKVVIRCSTATVTGASIIGVGRDQAKAILFENCEVTSPAKCTTTTQIKTNQTKSQLVRYGSPQQKVGDLFEPTQGEEFASVLITGAGCPFNQAFPIKGSVVAELKPEGAEVQVGELAFPVQPITQVLVGGQQKPIKLSIGAAGNIASFNGKFESQLVTQGQTLEKFGAFL